MRVELGKTRTMKVLIACEESQTVCKAFRDLGHEAYSCDLQECSGGHPEWHIKGDAIKVLHSQSWDLVIAHPPCDYLANSGVRWRVERNEWDQVRDSCVFFNHFVDYGLMGNKIVIENPIQHKYARKYITKYHQIIQPYQFGHMEMKSTCLWVYNLPLLVGTDNVYEEMMKLDYKDRARVHYCPPGPDRAKIRSKTYPGIAKAMVLQYGGQL